MLICPKVLYVESVHVILSCLSYKIVLLQDTEFSNKVNFSYSSWLSLKWMLSQCDKIFMCTCTELIVSLACSHRKIILFLLRQILLSRNIMLKTQFSTWIYVHKCMYVFFVDAFRKRDAREHGGETGTCQFHYDDVSILKSLPLSLKNVM